MSRQAGPAAPARRAWASFARATRPAWRWAPWLVSAGLVALFLRTFSLAEVLAGARAARPAPLGLAAAANLVALSCRSVAWGALLAPQHRVTGWQLSRYGIAAAAVSSLVPARAGELVRLRLLQCRHGVAPAVTVSVTLAEKVLDALSLFVLAAPVPWLLPGLPGWVGRSVGIGLAAGLGLLAGLVAVARRLARGAARARRLAPWLRALARPPGRLAAAFLLVAASWQAEIWVVQATVAAVGQELSWAAAMTVLLAVNLAIAVPLAPGHIGLLEAGALAGLRLFDLPQEACLSFALLYRLVQLLPVVALGAVDFRLLVAGLRPAPSSPRR